MSMPYDSSTRRLAGADLRRLVQLLLDESDDVIAPVDHDGVIRLAPISTLDEVVVGVVDEQEAGAYRLRRTSSAERFTYGPGPDSLKSIVHPPRRHVWTMRRSDDALQVDLAPRTARRVAVVGVRDCDLRALATLVRTQTDGDHPNDDVDARRSALFIVAVDCSRPAPTCFCVSMGGGPAASSGFDIALTEFVGADGRSVEYVARVGSGRGAELLERLELAPATAHDRAGADAVVRRASQAMMREMPPDVRSAVSDPDHPRWDSVADRCLTCANCTAVCPTCFCTDVDDAVSLDGESATRHQVWDSCFSMEYSALGGSPHRASPRSRYRQWLTHKLGTWHDQFGESGCVGCGRCITWCPVGIDLTAEVEALGREPQEST